MKSLLLQSPNVQCDIIDGLTRILSEGCKEEEILCGGLINQVRSAFNDIIIILVNFIKKSMNITSLIPGLCRLCITPYTKNEENAIVESGLVGLLDKLSSGIDDDQENFELPEQSAEHKVAKSAWVAFQVLANRCLEWKSDSSQLSLAKQVSKLITNQLVQSSSLSEVLGLLLKLSQSQLGLDILRQPRCVSKLLSLLLDPTLSPKLILTIVKLCIIALPAMNQDNLR